MKRSIIVIGCTMRGYMKEGVISSVISWNTKGNRRQNIRSVNQAIKEIIDKRKVSVISSRSECGDIKDGLDS